MATVDLQVIKTGYVRSTNPDHHYSTSASGEYDLGYLREHNSAHYRLYFGLQDMPNAYRYYEITAAKARVCVKGGAVYDIQGVRLYPCADFNASTLTWNTKPATTSSYYWADFASASSFSNIWIEYERAWEDVPKYRGFFITSKGPAEGTLPAGKIVLSDSSTPYLRVTYDQNRKTHLTVNYKSGPKDGAFSNPRVATSFAWANTLTSYDSWIKTATQASAIFYWKTSSASTWNQITISGSATSVTIPANTFPVASTIQWKVSVTDSGETTTSTGTFTFSTSASTVYAEVVSPVNSLEANNEQLVFWWRINKADAFPCSRVQLDWKPTDSNAWIPLLDVNEEITSFAVDPGDVPLGGGETGSFPAGEIDWRVRAYNVDGIAGPYSQALFVAFGAPPAPIVDSNHAPFTTMMWQSGEQQAFELNIAGKRYGPYFGVEKTFTLPDYLEDGEYPAKVRVLGHYGMWSEWGEITLYIKNVPGEPITLYAKTDVDADLSWETEELTADFLVYRDGVQIGHTYRTAFTDRYSNGEVEYFVVNRFADGNYSKSPKIERRVKLSDPYIALEDGGEWLAIHYQLSGEADPEYDESTDVSYYQMSGHPYRDVTKSEFLDTTISISAVFLYNQTREHEQFKSLFGKSVIVKFPDGWSGVCMLDSWHRNPKKHYYTAYTFTLRRIDWEDYVDDTH